MSVRELVALGTSSQVPTRYRNHNGYLLRWDEEGLLFDPGEGTQRQMIFADVTATSITKVLITHFHGDHCLGFAGITQRLSLDRVQHPVNCYFPASGRVYYDRLRRSSIYHSVATLEPHPIAEPGVIFENRKIQIRAEKLDHGVDTYGYRLKEHDGRTMLPEKLRELGVQGRAIGELQRNGKVLVGDREVSIDEASVFKRGQSAAFVMDTRLCDGAFKLAQGVDMLICESTYLSSEEKEAVAHGHMTARHAATVAQEAKAKKLVLTHFSQRYQSTKPFVEEAAKVFSGEIVAARDGKRFPIDRPSKNPAESGSSRESE